MKTKLYIILLLLVFGAETGATIRYVSKSGTNIEPCTTWTTASTTIMGAYSLCSANDTIMIGEGVYEENLVFYDGTIPISLIGVNPATTIIDVRGLNPIAIYAKCNLLLSGLTVYGKGIDGDNLCVGVIPHPNPTTGLKVTIENCILRNASMGVFFDDGSLHISKSSILDANTAIMYDQVYLNTDEVLDVSDCFILSHNNAPVFNGMKVAIWVWYGTILFRNNIVRGSKIPVPLADPMLYAINVTSGVRGGHISNNIFAGFLFYLTRIRYASSNDPGSLQVHNNILTYSRDEDQFDGAITNQRKNTFIYNNILIDNGAGLNCDTCHYANYNSFFRNKVNIWGTVNNPVGNLFVDPMVTNDSTAVTAFDQLDYHLQKYSPLIDAGDPSVMDRDGTRSDIGLYGGPFGTAYEYLDLPPRKPRGIHSFYQEGIVYLKWTKNTEADFKEYRLYRDTVAQFTPSAATLLSAQGDTLYSDSLTMPANGFYYRIAAVDSQGNVSDYSHQVSVVFVGVDEPKVSEEMSYSLEQNYPNPFNPKTTIRFTVKERCRVMVTVYDMEGAEVYNSGNRYYGRGENEMEIDMSGLASGIYLYRINAVNEENIPVFRDVKKMILLK